MYIWDAFVGKVDLREDQGGSPREMTPLVMSTSVGHLRSAWNDVSVRQLLNNICYELSHHISVAICDSQNALEVMYVGKSPFF